MSGTAYLLCVVEVEQAKRIRCQAKGCGHGVYARVHVVLDNGSFVVLGGDCFQRLYGSVLRGVKSFYGGSVSSPTALTEEMRQLLDTNTAAFVEQLEQRRHLLEAAAANRVAKVEVLETAAYSNGAASAPIAANCPSGTLGEYRYTWSATWWVSSAQLLADVRRVLSNSRHIDIIYRGVVQLIRRPTISPVDFAKRIARHGMPGEGVLECLFALGLVVRTRLSDMEHAGSKTVLDHAEPDVRGVALTGQDRLASALGLASAMSEARARTELRHPGVDLSDSKHWGLVFSEARQILRERASI